MHTNSFDEALALPTDFSARIARNTQILLQEECGICQPADPWGGSYYVEELTQKLMAKARGLIAEVEALGGMTNAIEEGLPKRRIEEAATRTQAQIDSGLQKVLGVNCFGLENETPPEVLKVDNYAVRAAQIRRLDKLRTERDDEKTRQTLNALSHCAKTGEGNLLAASLEAARAGSTVGEISQAMESQFGRHHARPQLVRGVYEKHLSAQGQALKISRQKIESFTKKHDRKPRILVAKLGQDGHDRGQKVVASAFADLGWEVTVGELFQTPDEAAKSAAKAKVDVVGASSLAAGHLTLLPELRAALQKYDHGEALVVVGGVIPPEDVQVLRQMGAANVFLPGTVITQASDQLISKMLGEAMRDGNVGPGEDNAVAGQAAQS